MRVNWNGSVGYVMAIIGVTLDLSHKSQNAPVPCPTMHHFVTEMCITMHLLSIERADCPKLHDMFKAFDAKAWQGEFPVAFPVRVCASNLFLINIFLEILAHIESKGVIKAKHVL